jgi:molybdopterin adenylyltransferase
MEPIKIGVINVSDRASAGIYEDIPGKAVVETLKEYLVSEFETVYKVIPDEQDLISETLKYMSDTEGCCLIVTTGGTDLPKEM